MVLVELKRVSTPVERQEDGGSKQREDDHDQQITFSFVQTSKTRDKRTAFRSNQRIRRIIAHFYCWVRFESSWASVLRSL